MTLSMVGWIVDVKLFVFLNSKKFTLFIIGINMFSINNFIYFMDSCRGDFGSPKLETESQSESLIH